MNKNTRFIIIALYIVLIPISLYFAKNIKFEFDFEQFFPLNDPELVVFRDFVEDFETDDNFLIVSPEPSNGVIDSTYISQVHQFTLACRKLPYIKHVSSLTTMDMPIKTPFGYNAIPLIHLKNQKKQRQDIHRLTKDPRFMGVLMSKDTSSLSVNLKFKDNLSLPESDTLMTAVKDLSSKYTFSDVHYLGRANFQSEMVKAQRREIIVSSIISGILVLLIMIFIFKKPMGVLISLGSITIGLLFLFGLLSALGRPLNMMSALYPILMLIVGTSDVVHIMSKYIDELKKGKTKDVAMRITVRQIGVATLLTSLTTAVGFLTLNTSNILPIKQFAVDAAIGVVLAYVVVITLTVSLLMLFDKDQLMKESQKSNLWDRMLTKWYEYTLLYKKRILWVSGILTLLFVIGMGMISTNYRIERNLPKGYDLTEDFRYFEEKYSGFRPMEMSIAVKNNEDPEGYAVMKEVNKIEEYLGDLPHVKSSFSLATVHKSIASSQHGGQGDYFVFPDNERTYRKSKRLLDRFKTDDMNAFVSKDGRKTRISNRIADVGAEVIKEEGKKIDEWIMQNTDTSLISVTQTGLGLIIDRNAEFVRKNLFEGLLYALIMVSILMVLLFRDWRLLLLAMVPNLMPLLFAGALLGYFGIELEASVSIIFAVIFGIAVDDTIHFLSKFRLLRREGLAVEEALKMTFLETGKAITFTTIILFFGFLVLLFSVHPPSFTIGLLISVTLIGAWICDLFLLPVLMRMVLKDE